MTLVRYNPFRSRNPWHEMMRLQHFMNCMSEDCRSAEESMDTISWRPSVNLVELDDKFEVSAELPGMSRDDVKVELQDNILTISGEKHAESENVDRNLYINERSFGSFKRSFNLPSLVESDKISAKFDAGILTVTMPKAEEAKPKQIEINVN